MLVKEVAYQDPLRLFLALKDRPYFFFLDSGMDVGGRGRYSLLGSDPFLVFRAKVGRVAVWEEGAWREEKGDVYSVLKKLLGSFSCPPVPGLPVAAGACGYFAYDLGRAIERLPAWAEDDLGLPECYLGFYDRLIILDHHARKVYLTSMGLPERGEAGARRAEAGLAALEEVVAGAAGLVPPPSPPLPLAEGKLLERHFTRASYCEAVRRAKEYIAAGDIFQVNLSQRFSCPLRVAPWELYRRLREVNPAPFAAFLSYPEVVVASASPERFLQVRGGVVETRPIKGTRPRGKDPAEDQKFREELLGSEKDRAELVMIVDLERNDLGRVSVPGSVHVPELVVLEEYPTVFHLVATVRGTLAPDKDLVDLLRATFPGGSITGAPKIRAMEIIEELEPVRRGIYTGSIGYLGFDGSADLNIVIRTFVVKDGVAYFQVGGGIVADSDPEAEYEETLAKARGLLRALGCEEEVFSRCCR